jgi:hypothetical protein
MTLRLDRDGFVIPHASYADAGGDGILLSVVAGLLGVLSPEQVDKAVFACISPKSGLLMRRPDNTDGNQSHDGYMAFAVWCQFRGRKDMARRLLATALKHGFYMKNAAFNFEGKPWKEKIDIVLSPLLVRYPKIWIALLAAALPHKGVCLFCSVAIQTLQSFDTVRPDDASGCQQCSINLYSVMLNGNPSPLRSFLKGLQDRGSSIADVMSTPYNGGLPFWDADSDVVQGYREFERKVLG